MPNRNSEDLQQERVLYDEVTRIQVSRRNRYRIPEFYAPPQPAVTFNDFFAPDEAQVTDESQGINVRPRETPVLPGTKPRPRRRQNATYISMWDELALFCAEQRDAGDEREREFFSRMLDSMEMMENA